MMLASADASGRILIWNIKSGEVKASFQEGSKPILQMEWLGEAIEDTGHMLLALHPSNQLVLWDTSSGKQIWKKTYFNEILRSFSFDPFDVSRIAFKTSTITSVAFIIRLGKKNTRLISFQGFEFPFSC